MTLLLASALASGAQDGGSDKSAIESLITEFNSATALNDFDRLFALFAKNGDYGVGGSAPVAAGTNAGCSGAVERAKPDPDIVERALSESGTERARAVMVGDAVWDVIAARRAGIPCIGLLSGGIAEEQLRDAGAIEVYPDASALLGNLRTSAIGRLGSGPRPPC